MSAIKTKLKVGDTVIVTSGGNKKTKPIKGKTAKIVKFTGTDSDRVILEGLNHVTKHQRATSMNDKGGKVQREASLHISNVMYYSEKAKAGVRLTSSVIDGKKVRGYKDPKSKEFVQI